MSSRVETMVHLQLRHHAHTSSNTVRRSRTGASPHPPTGIAREVHRLGHGGHRGILAVRAHWPWSILSARILLKSIERIAGWIVLLEIKHAQLIASFVVRCNLQAIVLKKWIYSDICIHGEIKLANQHNTSFFMTKGPATEEEQSCLCLMMVPELHGANWRGVDCWIWSKEARRGRYPWCPGSRLSWYLVSGSGNHH